MKKFLTAVILSASFIFFGCQEIENVAVDNIYTDTAMPVQSSSETTTEISAPYIPASETAELLSYQNLNFDIDEDFLYWCEYSFNNGMTEQLYNALQNNQYSYDLWYSLTGNTLNALYDLYYETYKSDDNVIYLGNNGSDSFSLGFTGDISLADNYVVMQYCLQQQNGIYDCLSPDLIDIMKSQDIMLVNNEFPYSDRGSPMVGKQWTFCAKPERVQILNELGVDIVSLANNHCYDYGEDAFNDTIDTLNNAGIPFVGAGKNIDEAKKPVYYIVNGFKIAYVSATKAEKYILTPEASENSGGVLRTYDPTVFNEVIADAKSKSDYVIAYVHWGTEMSNYFEQSEHDMGCSYIDNGADLIIGAHPHRLQGIEFYNGKPIVYSLGNFWFDDYDVDTGILEVKLDNSLTPELYFRPCIQKNCTTTLVENTDDGNRIIDFMKNISNNIDIDYSGRIYDCNE